MLRYSVLLPHRNAVAQAARLIADLEPLLAELPGEYEFLLVDDASSAQELTGLVELQELVPQVRILRFDQACGASVATAAGIAAARGELILSLDPGGKFSAQQVVELTSHLARADAVFGKRPRRGLAKLVQRVLRTPRWLLLGLDIRDPGCRCWLARREAVVGLEPSCGLLHGLAYFISMRGYRVCEVPLDYQRGPQTLADSWPHPGDLLTLWWRRRRFVSEAPREVVAEPSPSVLPLRSANPTAAMANRPWPAKREPWRKSA